MKRLMVCFSLGLTTVLAQAPASVAISNSAAFRGKHCEGKGDPHYLKLIDDSFAFFRASAETPNLSMLYVPGQDTFTEGSGWGFWWIQNSYGAVYCCLPFLQEPWLSVLQRSQDLFWDNMGDGKRAGLWGGGLNVNHLSNLVGPDGCLGDAAGPGQIAYKQGDGDPKVHDWFYEATAAMIVMQTEYMLISRDLDQIKRYLPKMERSCSFIEKTRDPKNNLFLVGPACNLLAPSYSGVLQPDGTYGKAYLAGLSITYLGALDKMAELYKLVGDAERLALCERRREITRRSLPQIMAPGGYFVKSVDPDGTKHGVYGQKKYGYFEVSPNVDAVALGVADQEQARTICSQIAAIPELRPFDFLITNYPTLDDLLPAPSSFLGSYGTWVNGGVWGTLEGRAIMAYYRVGAYEDIRRSANRAMKWAKDFRMDAPWTQFGENTDNYWYKDSPTAIMIDNFAIPAATVRGLFGYVYKSDRLELYPRVPPCIREYRQLEPIRFGDKRILISIKNGGPKLRSLTVNGKRWKVDASDHVVLPYEALPKNARVELVMSGGWPAAHQTASAPPPTPDDARSPARNVAELPKAMAKPHAALVAMQARMPKDPSCSYAKALLSEAISAFEAWRDRANGYYSGTYGKTTGRKRVAVLALYRQTALNMHSALDSLMNRYATDPDAGRQAAAKEWPKLR